jgi:YD repeat-containing protein
VIEVIDPNENSTANEYDALFNLTRVEDPLGFVTTSAFDEINRLTSVTNPLEDVTTYEYDEASNRTLKTDALENDWTSTYDANNRLVAETDPLGHTTTHAYDKIGNQTQITNAANEGDKPVQAVRQRLSKAGHTHHTDAESKSDYIWIDGKEKKQLVDLSQRVSKMGEDASADDINKAREELRDIMKDAVKAE